MISKLKFYHLQHLFIIFILLGLISSNAFANFYVVAGGGKKIGTEIKALPYTISLPGFYFITKDLTCAAGRHGITITVRDVTIDLMGFSLIGPEGTGSYHGIYVNNLPLVVNIEVRNGTIRNFQGSGYFADNYDSIGHRIINIRARNNGGYGIQLLGSNNLVKDCTVFSNQDTGIYVGKGSTVTGNTCWGSIISHGIYANGGSTVIGNTCYSNGADGIITGYGCTVKSNTCRENTGSGIKTSYGTSVIGNTCYNNTHRGICVGSGSTVIGNTCRSNTNYGIHLADNCYVGQNTCYFNGTNMNTCATCTQDSNHAPSP